MVRSIRRLPFRFALVLVAVALLVATLGAPVAAIPYPSGTTGDWKWQELADGTLRITGSLDPTGALAVPATLAADGADRAVTEIGDTAFYYATGITSLVLPEGLRTIGVDAFGQCAGMTTVLLPDSLTTLGDFAFEGCEDLAAVTIPGGVTSVGDYVFAYSYGLEEVTVAYGVTGLGASMFEECSSLTTVHLPEGIASIPNSCFSTCTDLAAIAIPESVTAIGDCAFLGCALADVVLPFGVASIGQSAFQDCTTLKHASIYDPTASIGTRAFEGAPLLAPPATGGLCGFSMSTAQTYATANGLNFIMMTGPLPVLKIPAVWADVYGSTVAAGSDVDVSGSVLGSLTIWDYTVHAWIDDGEESLVATIAKIEGSGPEGVGDPPEGAYTASLTIPAGLSAGPHWLRLVARDGLGREGVVQDILIHVAEAGPSPSATASPTPGANPETGDGTPAPWLPLLLAALAAGVLFALRRPSMGKR